MSEVYDFIKDQLNQTINSDMGKNLSFSTNIYGNQIYCNHFNNLKHRRRNIYKAWRLQGDKNYYYIKKWEREYLDREKLND